MADLEADPRRLTPGRDKSSDSVPSGAVATPPKAGSHSPPPKRRRRGAKANSDKKYECKHPACGKSYSRAEHLYRHQLNHTPKNIYRCNYPGCTRYFVRQDLCLRHRERHTTHGSQLQKKDGFPLAAAPRPALPPAGGANGAGRPPPLPANGLGLHDDLAMALDDKTSDDGPAGPPTTFSDTRTAGSSGSYDSRFEPPTPRTRYSGPSPVVHRSSGADTHPLSPEGRQMLLGRADSFGAGGDVKHDLAALASSTAGAPPNPTAAAGSPPRPYPHHAAASREGQAPYYPTFPAPPAPAGADPAAPSRPPPPPPPPPATFPATATYSSPNLPRGSAAFAAADVSGGLAALDPAPAMAYLPPGDGLFGVDMAGGYLFPVFGGDDYDRSPNAMRGDFTAWLFEENQAAAVGPYLPAYADAAAAAAAAPPFAAAYPPPDTSALSSLYVETPPPARMTDVLEASAPAQSLSDDKRRDLLELMRVRFTERPHDAVKKRKDAVFEGDVDADDHILGLRMMHTYIGSYWCHQHAQLPILHRPTFAADRTPDLLLLMVIAIGAATLDKAHGTSLTDSAAEFANFIVWHVRWEILRDADCRPPAQLWIFQTLLLVEIYEKMYATRALHERGHIHHDATLTLMRRGSLLVGRPAEPPSKDARPGPGTDETWSRWIVNEATRRAAFAAFVMDSIHTTMFGHSAKMVAHEVRLPLPCDEGLWSATSAAEVARLQSSLQTNGVKPTFFLDGLKRTLSGQRVRTNSFGRTILMAGLLSVSWHLNQRDLSLTHLGLGPRDKWRSALLRAFDNWKRDFDQALVEAAVSAPEFPTPLPRALGPQVIEDENIFESRTVLHHLAHMASHVDIVDCQVFAGANRILGRSITPKDYSTVRERITERWATRASARDAAFYALKFLAQVLIYEGDRFGHASSPILPRAFERDQYFARDDFLLNRPWVLYFSTLVVWCYGYALEGPIVPPPRDEDFATHEQRVRDMRDYLARVGGIKAPDDLENVQGRNRCLGLLLILRESFGLTRWELTREAASLLGNCIAKLRGQDGVGPALA